MSSEQGQAVLSKVSPEPTGINFLFMAYLIWGLGPVYWKWLSHVPPFELVMQRTWWSLVFLIIILVFQKRYAEIKAVLRNPRHMALLVITTSFLAFNWYLFIWAVNNDQVLQTSLGYYINPLITVFLGMMFLKERLRKLQAAALLLAAAAVLYYSAGLGEFPWIAIAIAGSFAIYGLIHKMLPVKPLPALCMETFLLSVPALFYIGWLQKNGTGSLFHMGLQTDFLLAGTCLVTALPLLFFTMGTRYAALSTVGFMQYIAPCCTFLLAVFYYHEPFSIEKLVTFIMIWVALMIFSVDTFFRYRHGTR